MENSLSVIVCTHNPRAEYLARVLDSLRAQTLDVSHWDLLVVDNASVIPVSQSHAIDWHPRGRFLVEPELGLTPARLRGIAEASAETLVFVDDDNVLDPEFLRHAAAIGSQYAFLGAWGGDLKPEFEREPPAWAHPFLPWLALRDVTRSSWSNDPEYWKALPFGAGLCIRRSVARHYAEILHIDQRRRGLDRKGTSLISGGDIDMVMTCRTQGLGWGVFPELKLKHLISASRLDPAYLERLGRGISYSAVMLGKVHGVPVEPVPATWRRATRFLRTWQRENLHAARIRWAADAGRRDGLISVQGNG